MQTTPWSVAVSHLALLYPAPQAFSHFTFERSGHQLIVVDIQGVGDLYTDPQIHTEKGTDFGDGNLGRWGKASLFPWRSHSLCPLQISQLFIGPGRLGLGFSKMVGMEDWDVSYLPLQRVPCLPLSQLRCLALPFPCHTARPCSRLPCSVCRCPGDGALLLLSCLQPDLQEHGPRSL